MSWGEAQPQPPFDPDNPYAGGPQQAPGYPGQPQPQQPGWAAPQPFGPGQGYPQPPLDPNNPYAQPGYPQQAPLDPTNPYAQPGYPQQAPLDPTNPYAQPGYPQAGYAPFPTAPPKKGNGALIAIVVGAIVVVCGGVTAAIVLTGGHNGGSPVTTASRSVDLAAPANISGLTKLDGAAADDAVASMRQTLAAASGEYPDPLLAAYNDGGGSTVTTILLDEPVDKLSATGQAQLASLGSASAVVSQIMSGAGVSNARTEPTSAAGGALSCGSKSEDGTDVTICVWYDSTTYGTLQYLDGTSPQVAAPVADAVRAAAEG